MKWDSRQLSRNALQQLIDTNLDARIGDPTVFGAVLDSCTVDDLSDRFKEERDRAFDEARESRQIPAPIKLELTLPTALPDLNVALRPSVGVEIIRDHAGNITGTKPRGSSVDTVTKTPKNPNLLKAQQSQDNLA